MSGASGNAIDMNGIGFSGPDAVYTAFGERVVNTFADGAANRYGYVGAHGYQSHGEMVYSHVGARYYDPASGRFLQRDPIGITGGLNVYEYVENAPTALVDPDGLSGSINSPQGMAALIQTEIDIAGPIPVTINNATVTVRGTMVTKDTVSLICSGRRLITFKNVANKGFRLFRTSKGFVVKGSGHSPWHSFVFLLIVVGLVLALRNKPTVSRKVGASRE